MQVALFPGQGSQRVGMGKTLCENFAVARETFEEASDAISLNMKALCFDGPESDLKLTENTQPALVTVALAAYRVLVQETGFKADAVAGHSLGEYAALVASGALPFSSAVKWVRARGQAMQTAVPAGQGTMAAVLGVADEVVREVCEAATLEAKKRRSAGEASDLTVAATVEPANFNAPGQVVIAGSRDAIDLAIADITTGRKLGKAMLLPVSAPFHCSLMRPAREAMAKLFASAPTPDRPRIPYVPNRTARMTDEPGVIFDLLIEQMDHPVLWSQSVQLLMDRGFTSGVEFGPGGVLAGLCKRIAKSAGKEFGVVAAEERLGLKS